MKKVTKSILALLTLVLLITVPVSASEQGTEGEVILTPEKEGNVLVGEKVIYTAQASGEEEIEYGFSESYEGIAATDDIIYSSENTYTFEPKKAGSYVVEVEVRAKEAKTVKGRQSITIEVKAPENAELTGNLTSSRGNAAVYIDRTVTLTGSHTGGIGVCKYQYTEEYNGQTKVVRAYDKNPKYTFNTSGKGKHTYHLDIQDESGQTVRVSHSMQVNPEKSRVLSGTLKSSRGNAAVYVNRTVMLTGNHSGGYGGCEYQYSEVYNGKTTVVQAYSSNRNYTFKTKGVGKHTYYLVIRDEEGQTVRKSYTVQINPESSKKLTGTFKSSRGNAAVYINRTITLTGKYTGGYGKCEYRYTESYKGSSKVMQDYGEKSTYVIRTKGVGKHIYYLDIRDEQGQTVRKTYTVQVNPEPGKALKGRLQSNKATSIYVNRSVTMTGSYSGGYGECQYRYREAYGSTIKVKKDYSTDSQYRFTTSGVGSHIIYLDIKDEQGQTTTISYKLQVTVHPDFKLKGKLTGSASGTIKEKQSITLTASSSGGYSTPHRYKFSETYNGKTKVLQGYSPKNTYSFKISGAGIHTYYVEIADGQNQILKLAKSYSIGKNGWYYENGYKYYYSKNKRVEDVSGIIGKQSSYVIKVNKKMNCITIYAKDGNKGYIIPVKSMACSTGYATPVGTFYSGIKHRWHQLFGAMGQYTTQITGNYLFHSVLYTRIWDPYSLSASSYNKLGTTASHGCIRLRVIDAKWIYDNCKSGTKVIIYNSSVAGPFKKPVYAKIPATQKYDPTDPSVR